MPIRADGEEKQKLKASLSHMAEDMAIADIILSPIAEALSHIVAVIAIHITVMGTAMADAHLFHSVMSKLTVTGVAIQATAAAVKVTAEEEAVTVAVKVAAEGETATTEEEEDMAAEAAVTMAAADGAEDMASTGITTRVAKATMEIVAETGKNTIVKAAVAITAGAITDKAGAVAAEDMATKAKEAADKEAGTVAAEDTAPVNLERKQRPAIMPLRLSDPAAIKNGYFLIMRRLAPLF
jgi:glucosamine 6-phosphate synthetase-like amidotransferase/phosphosugar isomerase protein